MQKLNEVVDKLKDIFGEQVKVEGTEIVGTPIYIEFTDDRVPNLAQLYGIAEHQRTKRSDARMTVVMAEPKYGAPMACMSVTDFIEIFEVMKEVAISDVDDLDDDDDPEEEEPEAEDEPVVATKLPLEEEPASDEPQIPGPTEVPEKVMEAIADNISEPDPATEDVAGPDGDADA